MQRLRLDKAALFEMLGYEPHAAQLAVHRSKARFRVVCAGVRWGKSVCAAHECIAAVMEPRESSIGWVVAPTYDLAERIFERVKSIVVAKLQHRVRTMSERERRIVLINAGGGTSELRAKSADNPDSLLGEGLDFVVVDEATRLKQEIWFEHLSQRLIDKKGWGLLISTPKGWDWFARLHRRGQRGRDAAFESWTSPSWVNARLDRALIEEERERLTEDAFDEQFGAVFLGEDPFPCDRCGGPDPAALGIVLIDGPDEPPRCPDCGLYIDKETGRTIVSRWPDGRAHVKIVHLMGPRQGEESVPAIEFGPGSAESQAPIDLT